VNKSLRFANKFSSFVSDLAALYSFFVQKYNKSMQYRFTYYTICLTHSLLHMCRPIKERLYRASRNRLQSTLKDFYITAKLAWLLSMVFGVLLLGSTTAYAKIPSAFITTCETKTDREEIGFNSIDEQSASDSTGVVVSTFTDYDVKLAQENGSLITFKGDNQDRASSYAVAGEYPLIISGTFPAMELEDITNWQTNAEKLQPSYQRDEIISYVFDGVFRHTKILTYNATNVPNRGNAIYSTWIFEDASSFNGNLSDWRVLTVTDLSSMFPQAPAFNQEINGLVVWNAVAFSSMFADATAFNQDLVGWDAPGLEFMHSSLRNATSCNHSLDQWYISSVACMMYMFYGATSFNQNISINSVNQGTDNEYKASEILKVPLVYSTFTGTEAFNQDLRDVSNSAYYKDYLGGMVFFQENYIFLLRAWSHLDLVDGMTLSLDVSYFCYSEVARQSNIEQCCTINNGRLSDENIIPLLFTRYLCTG